MLPLGLAEELQGHSERLHRIPWPEKVCPSLRAVTVGRRREGNKGRPETPHITLHLCQLHSCTGEVRWAEKEQVHEGPGTGVASLVSFLKTIQKE